MCIHTHTHTLKINWLQDIAMVTCLLLKPSSNHGKSVYMCTGNPGQASWEQQTNTHS